MGAFTVTYRPATDQEVADAHDTAQYVLAHTVRLHADDARAQVTVTEMRPSCYVEVENGWAHFQRPDIIVSPYRHTYAWLWEDLFAFEITRPLWTRDSAGRRVAMPNQDAQRYLERLAKAARAVGAGDVQVDMERRVITGTFLYLPDHPVVAYVRAFGHYSAVDGKGRHAPAEVPPYASRPA